MEQEGEDADIRPRRRLTQAESREQTRRQLLAAAARAFAQKGLAGASLEEIAELAGYTTGALYYHFSNKEQLFVELLRTGWSRQTVSWMDVMDRVRGDETTDLVDTLARFAARRAERDNQLEPLRGEFWLYALRHPQAMTVVADQLRQQAEGLQPVIATLMEQSGSEPGIAADEMATIALALLQGLTRRRRIDPTAVPDDLFARALRRLLAPRGDASTAS